MNPDDANLEATLRSGCLELDEHDMELLSRPESRHLRLQVEFLKPELALREQRIRSTIVVFGSTEISPELCFQFHYFALRKLHFLLRARALVAFPGGFGTLDELFDALTLRQTGRMQAIPIVMFGRAYWEQVLDLEFLADEGVIDDADLDLVAYAETPQQILDIITRFHRLAPATG